jgi:hypothetical protein
VPRADLEQDAWISLIGSLVFLDSIGFCWLLTGLALDLARTVLRKPRLLDFGMMRIVGLSKMSFARAMEGESALAFGHQKYLSSALRCQGFPEKKRPPKGFVAMNPGFYSV